MLSAKTAVITGSTKGIGKGTALEMAKEGIRVVISSRSQSNCEKVAAEINSSGGKAIAVECDISKPEDAKNLIKQTLKWQGRIDILVNNAGIDTPYHYIADYDPKDWLNNITVNLLGTFNMTSITLKYFSKSKNGIIINLVSGASLRPFKKASAYSVSKAGILMFTKCIDLEYSNKGIFTYAVRPGVIYTDMIRNAVKANLRNEKEKDCLSVNVPAKLITWLATDKPKDLKGKMVDVFDKEIQKRAGLKLKNNN